jgi:hypothetical protein
MAAMPRTPKHLHALIAFLGAFLLFVLELAAAKLLLPAFGGSAWVWIVSMMFFQGLLLVGYLYVHWGLQRLREPLSSRLHLGLLVLAGLSLPVALGSLPALGSPTTQLLATLFKSVGLPVFVLAATTPLMHAWWSRAQSKATAEPYALFAASNAGAFAALFAYVFVFELTLGLVALMRAWTGLYIVFVLLQFYCLPKKAAALALVRGPRISTRQRALWLLASAGPCAVLLAATNLLTYDFAAAPLVWMVPLAVYLATIVLSFKQPPFILRRMGPAFIGGTVLLLGGYAVPALKDAVMLLGRIVFILGSVFVVGMILHRALAENKPAAGRATEFYAWVALGGWLGSLLIAVVLPGLAGGTGFLGIDWMAATVVSAAAMILRDWGQRRAVFLAASVALCCLLLGLGMRYGNAGQHFGLRNFYGVYAVAEAQGLRTLYHGNTHHGMQELARPGLPLPYYHPQLSPIGDVFKRFGGKVKTIGVVGLGVGALAAFGQAGQQLDFYELDPDVEPIARRYFSFIKESGAEVRVIPGDARLSLAAHSEKKYDLIIIDAFSGGTIPVHLLTTEALQLYFARLGPQGLLVLHISNRYLDLAPLLSALARHLGLAGALHYAPEASTHREPAVVASRWVVLSADGSVARQLVQESGWQDLQEVRPGALWTDDRSSLLPLLSLSASH